MLVGDSDQGQSSSVMRALQGAWLGFFVAHSTAMFQAETFVSPTRKFMSIRYEWGATRNQNVAEEPPFRSHRDLVC